MIVRYFDEAVGPFKANPKAYKLDEIDYHIQGWDDSIGPMVDKLDKMISKEIKETYNLGLTLAKLINKTQDRGAIKRWKTLTTVNKSLKKSRKKLNRLNLKKAPKVKETIETIVVSSREIRKEIDSYIKSNISSRKKYQGID